MYRVTIIRGNLRRDPTEERLHRQHNEVLWEAAVVVVEEEEEWATLKSEMKQSVYIEKAFYKKSIIHAKWATEKTRVQKKKKRTHT